MIDNEAPSGVRGFAAKPLWASVELLLAVAVIVAGLSLPIVISMVGAAPWLVAIGAIFLWWRGPGLRAIGLSRPTSLLHTLMVGLVVGVGYQLVGTFAVEPAIVRLTSGELPDVSLFRSVVGNERQLAYWIALSWTLGALLEEVAFRGWILTRFAEIGRFSGGSWVGGALASSALFGVVHAYQGVSGMIGTGLTAFVFASVYLATGRNLWTAIATHGVLDTTAFVMMYFGVYPGI